MNCQHQWAKLDLEQINLLKTKIGWELSLYAYSYEMVSIYLDKNRESNHK